MRIWLQGWVVAITLLVGTLTTQGAGRTIVVPIQTSDDGAITIQATVNGKPLVFVVDTGADTMIVVNKIPAGPKGVQTGHVTGVGGSQTTITTEGHICLQDICKDVEVEEVDPKKFAYNLLPLAFLAQFQTMTIDFAHDTITLTEYPN